MQSGGLKFGIFYFFIPLKWEAHTHNFSVKFLTFLYQFEKRMLRIVRAKKRLYRICAFDKKDDL